MTTKKCPYCGEEIQASAKKCRFCGEWLEQEESQNLVEQTTSNISAGESAKVVSPEVYEPYYMEKWKRYTALGICLFFLLLAICTVKIPFKFDYFFGDIEYWVGFAFLSLIFLVVFLYTLSQHRNTRIYLSSNGKLDISTPRHYESLKMPAVVKCLGRSYYVVGDYLKSFDYADGRISLNTIKGNSIESKLSDITWKYSMTKPKGADDWSIYKYVVTDNSGNSIKFYSSNEFEPEEWDDINMLLSTAGNVEESKTTKINKKLMKVLESVDNFDFSDVTGSALELGKDTIVSYSGTNKVIDMVKAKIYKKNSSAKSIWAKIKKGWEYLIMGLVVLWALAVGAYNIFMLVDYLSDSDKTEVVSDSEIENMVQLKGKIDDNQEITMFLDFETGKGYYYYDQYGPDHKNSLKISADDGWIYLAEFNDKNEQVAVFKVSRVGTSLVGHYTYYGYENDKEMFVNLQLVDDGESEDSYTVDNSYTVDETEGDPPIDGYDILDFIKSETKFTHYDGDLAYTWKGYFIKGGNKYPVELLFVSKYGDITYVDYKNIRYNVKMRMDIISNDGEEITLRNAKENFTIKLHVYDGELFGTARQGSSELDVRLSPVD